MARHRSGSRSWGRSSHQPDQLRDFAFLQTLRDKLRTKEIWIEGAKRYCDPDQDLPADFDARKEHYFDLLRQPQDAAQFVQRLRDDMRGALIVFDQGFPANKDVKLKSRGREAPHFPCARSAHKLIQQPLKI